MRTVGNVVTGDDQQTQKAIDAGAIHAILALMKHPKLSLRQEACWAISNITAGSWDQTQKVLEAGAMEPLIMLMINDAFKVSKEAAWAVVNALNGENREQVKLIASQQCVTALCGMLVNNNDKKLLAHCLGGLNSVLKSARDETKNPFIQMIAQCRGIASIRALRDHPDVSVSENSQMVYKYLEGENDIGVGENGLPPCPELDFEGEKEELGFVDYQSPVKRGTFMVMREPKAFIPGEIE
jgi:importin subunit alpha-1